MRTLKLLRKRLLKLKQKPRLNNMTPEEEFADVPLVGDRSPYEGERVAVCRFSKHAFESFLKGVFGGVRVSQNALPIDASLVGVRIDEKTGMVDYLVRSSSFKPVVANRLPILPDVILTTIGKKTIAKLDHESRQAS